MACCGVRDSCACSSVEYQVHVSGHLVPVVHIVDDDRVSSSLAWAAIVAGNASPQGRFWTLAAAGPDFAHAVERSRPPRARVLLEAKDEDVV